jgi:beta-glucosidase
MGRSTHLIQDGDMGLISEKLDFLGLNYYSPRRVSAKGLAHPIPGAEYTEMGWEVDPLSLRRLLIRLNTAYGLPPVYITENGAAFTDAVTPDGKIHDERRLRYIQQHLLQCLLSIEDGVDVRGYFVWSLLDNFEWTHGYDKRFGIVRVDFETQERTVKDSGQWYSHAIADNAVDDE